MISVECSGVGKLLILNPQKLTLSTGELLLKAYIYFESIYFTDLPLLLICSKSYLNFLYVEMLE